MDAEKFGSFVQQRRRELGMTQNDLAEKLYVTSKAVSRWERGIGFPDIKLLQPLADALDITIVELMHSEKIEKELSKEQASAMVTETVTQIQQQRKMTWKRKMLLYTGYVLIFAAYMVVHGVAQMGTLEPRWLGIPLIFISIYGFQYGVRALKAILTGTPFPNHQMVHIKMTKGAWLALACFVGGLLLLLFAMVKLDHHTGLRDFLTVSGLCVSLFGGVYYCQFVQSQQNQK